MTRSSLLRLCALMLLLAGVCASTPRAAQAQAPEFSEERFWVNVELMSPNVYAWANSYAANGGGGVQLDLGWQIVSIWNTWPLDCAEAGGPLQWCYWINTRNIDEVGAAGAFINDVKNGYWSNQYTHWNIGNITEPWDQIAALSHWYQVTYVQQAAHAGEIGAQAVLGFYTLWTPGALDVTQMVFEAMDQKSFEGTSVMDLMTLTAFMTKYVPFSRLSQVTAKSKTGTVFAEADARYLTYMSGEIKRFEQMNLPALQKAMGPYTTHNSVYIQHLMDNYDIKVIEYVPIVPGSKSALGGFNWETQKVYLKEVIRNDHVTQSLVLIEEAEHAFHRKLIGYMPGENSREAVHALSEVFANVRVMEKIKAFNLPAGSHNVFSPATVAGFNRRIMMAQIRCAGHFAQTKDAFKKMYRAYGRKEFYDTMKAAGMPNSDLLELQKYMKAIGAE